jgi:hypothetical protein
MRVRHEHLQVFCREEWKAESEVLICDPDKEAHAAAMPHFLNPIISSGLLSAALKRFPSQVLHPADRSASHKAKHRYGCYAVAL